MAKHTSTEDLFVREMILHGRPERACQEAFPHMAPEYVADAIAYMMDDPEVRARIEAGIIYFYRDHLNNIEIPPIKEVSIAERRALLKKIIAGERKHPSYVRNGDVLQMIMLPPTEEEVRDAIRMDKELEALELNLRQL